MYAIVEIAGKQFKVAKDQYIYAPKLEGDAGTAVNFDKVLLVDDGSAMLVGVRDSGGCGVCGMERRGPPSASVLQAYQNSGSRGCVHEPANGGLTASQGLEAARPPKLCPSTTSRLRPFQYSICPGLPFSRMHARPQCRPLQGSQPFSCYTKTTGTRSAPC